jgi:hypothetical protein
MMTRLVLRNIFYYWKKTSITILLAGIILSVGISSIIFTSYIKKLVDQPLQSLKTEIILQRDTSDKNPGDIKTSGVILPFNLASFSKDQVSQTLPSIPGVKNISTSLVLWQFDVKNNRTIVALDVNEPKVGLRNVESLLMPGGRFFTGNDSPEIILERHFATLFGYKVGGNYVMNNTPFLIIGLVDFREKSNLANAEVFMPYKTALRLIGERNTIVNQTFISLSSAAGLPQVESTLNRMYPGYSILSKDSLLKNLSGLNQLFYRFGTYLDLVMAVFSLLLTAAVLKLHRLEYSYQPKLLRTLGWPVRMIRHWLILDTAVILTGALVLAGLFGLLLNSQLPALIKLGPVLNYSLSL